jgi:hypothetical protein
LHTRWQQFDPAHIIEKEMCYKISAPVTYILLSVFLAKLGRGRTDQEDGLIKYIPPNTVEVYEPPGFGASATNYTVPKEGTAHLHCPVKIHGDIPISFPLVSWVRLSDWHILTNGVVSYTKDDRISVLYREGSFDWILQIKFAQLQDAGTYECQISVPTGTISRKVQLDVFHPESYILVGNNSAPLGWPKISKILKIESVPPRCGFCGAAGNGSMGRGSRGCVSTLPKAFRGCKGGSEGYKGGTQSSWL